MPAYGYLRKSSLPPDRQSMSPQAQEDRIRALAATRVHPDGSTDADGLKVLSDMDISGSAKYTAKRRGYQALIDAIQNGTCSTVYSYSLSRLARSTREVLRFFEICEGYKVPIVLVADSIDTRTASGKMLLTMLAAIAQFESEVASERLNATLDAKRSRGESVATMRAYGTARTRKDGATIPAEDVGPVIEAFKATRSYQGAARRLSEQGVPPHHGKRWWAASVRNAIKRHAPDLVLTNTTARVAAGGGTFALSKLLVCGTCDGVLTPRTAHSRTVYYCSRSHSQPHPRMSVPESAVMPFVEQEALLYRDPALYEQDASPDSVDARKADLEARRQVLMEMRLDKTIGRDEYNEQVRDIDSKLTRLSQRRQPQGRIDIRWDGPTQNRWYREVFERIAVDPATYLPVDYVWHDPTLRGDPVQPGSLPTHGSPYLTRRRDAGGRSLALRRTNVTQ